MINQIPTVIVDTDSQSVEVLKLYMQELGFLQVIGEYSDVIESYNAILIEQGKSQSERLILLRNLAIRQMDTLVSINLSAVSALPGDM